MKGSCIRKERLFALANHWLGAREEKRLNGHLEECVACREIVAGYRKLDATLGEWKPSEPSAWFDARVRSTAASLEPARPPRTFLGFEWARGLSTALAALLVVFSVTLIVQTRKHDRGTTIVQPATRTATPAVASANPSLRVQVPAAEQELRMYENLPLLEDYDLLANFQVLSELPKGNNGDGNATD